MLPGGATDKVEGSDKAAIAEYCQSIAMDTVVFVFVREINPLFPQNEGEDSAKGLF